MQIKVNDKVKVKDRRFRISELIGVVVSKPTEITSEVSWSSKKFRKIFEDRILIKVTP